jgi:hypothetical protein
MSRLIELTGLSKEDLFRDRSALLAAACRLRELKIAFART